MVSAFFVSLLLSTSTSPANGSDRWVQSVRETLQSYVQDPTLSDAKVAVFVKDITSDTTLFSERSDELLIPASNVKIVTSAAALALMGPDFRFSTEIYAELNPQGITPQLTIVGEGDPSIVPERLWHLASRIYVAGVREIRGDIVIDDSAFEGPREANGAEQDRTNNAYMALSGAVSIGFNTLQIHIDPSTVAGGAARILLDPPSRYGTIEGSITTVTKGRTSVNVDVLPQGDRSVVRVSGRIALDDGGRTFWRRIDNPPLFAGEVLRTALEQQGVKIQGRVKVGRRPEGVKPLLSYNSPRLSDIIMWSNKNSNNFVAQQLALSVGAHVFGYPANWSKAQTAIENFLEEKVGLRRGTYAIRNGSGLHDVNRFTAAQMVAILDAMYRQPELFPEFASSLAVAAGSGTLSERMQNTHAAHVLRAKTGTLSSSSALSGYLTTVGGHTLAFSVIVNDYKAIADAWRVQDQIGAYLAGLDPRNTAPVAQTLGQTTVLVP